MKTAGGEIPAGILVVPESPLDLKNDRENNAEI